MKVESIVIGIPDWSWKKRLLLYAKRHPRLMEVSTKGLCHECSRHFSVLRLFDNKSMRYRDTEYYKYQRKNEKRRSSILRKIFRFRQLYESIKKEGMKVAPVITDDGCRLDGSHRIAVVASLNKKTCVVNVARYEDIFSKERSRRIRKRVKEYRKEVYGL